MSHANRNSKLSRRDFLKTIGLGAGALVLHGCGSDPFMPTPYPSLTITPTRTPFQPGPATALPTATPLPSATATPTDLPTATSTQWIYSPYTQTATETQAGPGAGTGMVPIAPTAGGFCFVLWDHQLAQYNYKPRNPRVALPETCPLRSGAANRMTSDWEDYWRGILRQLNAGMSTSDFEASWKGLVSDARAFTNNSAPDSGNFALHSLTCGGATHVLVTGKPEGPQGRYMRIFTLSHEKGPPPVSDGIDITRHFMATTGSNKLFPDGSYAVQGFAQFENPIVPLISPDGTDLIEISRIKYVTAIQRPYNTWPHGCDEAHDCEPSPTPTSESQETPTP